ncbi:MAG: tetratricopeptide repeat protein [Planctomycetota bacterium]|jgi:tetratricopeptide (TPR) repeat protein
MSGIRFVLLPLLVCAAVVFAQEAGGDAAPHLKAAGEKFKKEDFQGAIVEFTSAIQVAPKDIRGWFGRAQAYLRLEKYKEAIADLDQAISINPKAAGIYQVRAGAKSSLHDYEGAIADYTEAAKLDQRRPEPLYMRGQLHETIGELDKAIEDYSASTLVVATWWQPYASRADAKANAGNYKSAMEDLEAALYLANQPGAKSSVLASRGRVKLAMGETKAALEDLNQCVKNAPDNPSVYFFRGRFLHDLGKWSEALADFRKHLELDSKSNEYVRFYVCLCQLRLGKKAEAEAELGTYLDMRRKQGDWFVTVAGFLAGRTKEEDFFKAAENENRYLTNERQCEASFYAAMRRDAAGEAEKAIELLEQCVACKVFNFIEYASSRAFLQRLKKK